MKKGDDVADDRRMIRVYVAGPYTRGDVAVNVGRACAAALDLMEAGFAAFCPHLFHFLHLLRPQPYEFWIAQDLEWLDACDCILRLPGPSSGADGEVEVAREMEIPVFGSVEQVIEAYRDDVPWVAAAERWIDG